MSEKNEIKDITTENPSDNIWVTEFSEQKAIEFHEAIYKKFEDNPYKPIIININSYGGDVTALFSMIDSMDSIRSMAPESFSFITSAKGKAISAGAVLLSYGDFRFSDPKTQIMIHQVNGGNWGSQPANEVEFTEISRVNKELLTILKERCKLNLSLSEFKAKLSHNLYLTAKEAKALGIIDVIGSPTLVEMIAYEVRVLNGERPKGKKNANRRTN